MAGLKKGMKAPLFALADENEKKVSLKDFEGKWVVVYFYPKDDTPGCSLEAKDFSKQLPGFTKLKAEVIGISADSCGSHKRFIKKKKLKVTLLSDEDKKVLKKYGVWKTKKFMGRAYKGTVRTTYLVDPKGKIVYIWNNVKPAGHAGEVKNKINELKEA